MAEAFTLVTTISALCFMFVWSIILISYIVYRQRRPQLHAASKFKMPGGTFMPYVVLAFFGFIIWALTTQADTMAGPAVHPDLVRGPGHRLPDAAPQPAARSDARRARGQGRCASTPSAGPASGPNALHTVVMADGMTRFTGRPIRHTSLTWAQESA